MYEIELSKKAAKFYQKANTATARRLNVAFDRLMEEPLHHHSIKPLVGELQGSYRMRVGDICIVYSIDEAEKTVFVEVIGFRGDVYK
jgi:mRNA interferase RelE/StbE